MRNSKCDSVFASRDEPISSVISQRRRRKSLWCVLNVEETDFQSRLDALWKVIVAQLPALFQSIYMRKTVFESAWLTCDQHLTTHVKCCHNKYSCFLQKAWMKKKTQHITNESQTQVKTCFENWPGGWSPSPTPPAGRHGYNEEQRSTTDVFLNCDPRKDEAHRAH